MRTFTVSGKTVSIFSSDAPQAPIIYLNTVSGEGQQVFQTARELDCPAFTLAAISDLNWERDLAPWDCPPAFKNSQPFTGGAGEHLRLLLEEIIPEAERKLPAAPLWRGIAGYSLAGLFAIYALYQTDAFSRAASVSGSLWFPGIREYALSREPKRRPDCVYFSLGDKEGRTRNPCLRDVQKNTEEIEAFYRGMEIHTVFRLNPGSHFDHPVERTAAGIAWILSGGEERNPQ